MIRKNYLFLVFLLISSLGIAQGGPPPPPPPGLPIDGGIFVLALVGLYFGIKKLKD